MSTASANHETREQPSTPPGLKPKHDYWENIDGKWKRHHVKPRTRLYRPGAEQRPNEQGPPETLVRGRRTIMQFSDGSMMEHHDRNAYPICAIIHTPTQTDDEEATKSLAKALSRRIGIPTFTSPGYSSGSLGHTERFIQTLWAQPRT